MKLPATILTRMESVKRQLVTQIEIKLLLLAKRQYLILSMILILQYLCHDSLTFLKIAL